MRARRLAVAVTLAVGLVVLVHGALVNDFSGAQTVSSARAEDDLARGGARKSTVWKEKDKCRGRRLFIYSLPETFQQVVTNCSAVCPSARERLCANLDRDGLGHDFENLTFVDSYEGSTYAYGPWLTTEQHMLGLLFHTRILNYDCVVPDWQQADAFYVPAFFGLLSLCARGDYFDLHADLLERYLAEQPGFQRRKGADHFIVSGQQIWSIAKPSPKKGWGGYLIYRPGLKNVRVMAVEAMGWERRTQSLPYPTAFHPASRAELEEWIRHVSNHPRNYLITLIGAPRAWNPLRTAAIEGCNNNSAVCTHVDCSKDCSYGWCWGQTGFCSDARAVSKLQLASTFCLQPPGDSYARRSIFDSMIAGCIPVFFSGASFRDQYKWIFPGKKDDYSITFDSKKVLKGYTNFTAELEKIPQEAIQQMQRKIVELIPRLIYRDHTREQGAPEFMDAFDVAIPRLFADIGAATAAAKCWFLFLVILMFATVFGL